MLVTRLKKIIKMPVVWKLSEAAQKSVENVYKFFVEEKQYGLKMLECTWDRTAALTGVSRVTAQRIIIQKVKLPSLMIACLLGICHC